MTLHVDVIENDWTERVQRRVAWVFVNGTGTIEVEGPQAHEWRVKLVRPITDPRTGENLDPGSAPKDFLEALALRLKSGSYLTAIGPHEAESCQLAEGGGVLPMEQVGVRPPA